MQLLLMKKPQILKAVKHSYPALGIRDFRIKVNLSYARHLPATEASQKLTAGDRQAAKNQQELERILATVSQEDLKGRLRRLFLKSSERDRSRRGEVDTEGLKSV
jgi:hypothetical protein